MTGSSRLTSLYRKAEQRSNRPPNALSVHLKRQLRVVPVNVTFCLIPLPHQNHFVTSRKTKTGHGIRGKQIRKVWLYGQECVLPFDNNVLLWTELSTTIFSCAPTSKAAVSFCNCFLVFYSADIFPLVDAAQIRIVPFTYHAVNAGAFCTNVMLRNPDPQ